MELDGKELEKLKELVPYKILSPTPQEIITEIERLNNILNELEDKIHNIWFKIDFTNMTSMSWARIKLDETSQGNDLLNIVKKAKENK